MPDSTIQIGTEIGIATLGTLITSAASITWWFSRQLKAITDSQTAMKAELTASQVTLKTELTKSINDVNTSQEKRDNDLDRSVASVQAALNSHSSLIEQKMNTLQSQMSDFAAQVKENRHDTNELRERVVRLETIAEKQGAPPERH